MVEAPVTDNTSPVLMQISSVDEKRSLARDLLFKSVSEYMHSYKATVFSNLPLEVDFATRELANSIVILLLPSSTRGCLPIPGKKDFDSMSRRSGRCVGWYFFG